MSVRYKIETGNHLVLIVCASLVLALLIAANGGWRSIQNENNIGSTSTIPLSTERLVADWRSNLTNVVMSTTLMVHNRESDLSTQIASIGSSKQNDELIKHIEGQLDTDQEKALFAKIVEIRQAYHAVRDTMLEQKSRGHSEEAVKILNEQYLPLSQRYQRSVSDLLQLERQDVNKESSEIVHASAFSLPKLAAIIALAFFAGATFCWWLMERRSGWRSKRSNIDSTGNWDSFYDTLA